jgi:hypothetical protein
MPSGFHAFLPVTTYLDSKVTPWVVHLGNRGPLVGDDVVPLGAVHSCDPVETADGVDMVSEGDDADTGAPVPHLRQDGPRPGGDIITLGGVHAFLAIETATDIKPI